MSDPKSHFPQVLRGGLWHTTSRPLFARIIQSAAILPNPALADGERQGTLLGPSHFPYVRHLGGVSLFDFADFDEFAYEKRFQSSSFYSFVPCRHDWEEAVWIEVDRTAVARHLITGADLYQRQRTEGAEIHRLMPLIEAAHLGPVPTTAFARVLSYAGKGWSELRPPRYEAVPIPAQHDAA